MRGSPEKGRSCFLRLSEAVGFLVAHADRTKTLASVVCTTVFVSAEATSSARIEIDNISTSCKKSACFADQMNFSCRGEYDLGGMAGSNASSSILVWFPHGKFRSSRCPPETRGSGTRESPTGTINPLTQVSSKTRRRNRDFARHGKWRNASDFILFYFPLGSILPHVPSVQINFLLL